MPLDQEQVREWVVNHQHEMVVHRYDDIGDGQEIVDFFARYLYPKFEDRQAYIERNEFIRKLLKLYKHGKLSRQLGASYVIYAPMVWLADRMKELPAYLERAVALYDQAEEMDGRLVDHLCDHLDAFSQLNMDSYHEAYRAVSTHTERRAQVNEVVDVGSYAVSIVERGGIVDLILRYVPHVPFFVTNPLVRGLNESLTMVQFGFRAFKNQKHHIHELKEMVRTRELEYVDRIFDKSETDAADTDAADTEQSPVQSESEK